MRNNAFDFLRLFLASIVVIHHACLAYNFTFIARIQAGGEGGGVDIGGFALYGFFLISGFLITASWVNSNNFGSFILKRVKRIYPGFWTALLISAFVVLPICAIAKGLNFFRYEYIRNIIWYIQRNFDGEMRSEFIYNLVNKNDVIHINLSAWTIILEIRSYLAIAIVGFFGLFNKRYLFLILLALSSVNFFFMSYNDLVDWNFLTGDKIQLNTLLATLFGSSRFFIFYHYTIIGIVAFLYKDKIIWNYGIFSICCLVLAISFWTNTAGIFMPITYSYIILFLSQALPVKNLAKKIGDWSYGTYLYGWGVYLIMFSYGLNFILPFPVYALINLIGALICGYLSYNLVEKHFLGKSKRIINTIQ